LINYENLRLRNGTEGEFREKGEEKGSLEGGGEEQGVKDVWKTMMIFPQNITGALEGEKGKMCQRKRTGKDQLSLS